MAQVPEDKVITSGLIRVHLAKNRCGLNLSADRRNSHQYLCASFGRTRSRQDPQLAAAQSNG